MTDREKQIEEDVAYTPRIEHSCKNSSTHYQGCECHEARHSERLRKSIDAVREFCDLAADHRVAEAVKAERLRCAGLLDMTSPFVGKGELMMSILNPPSETDGENEKP